jgi:hypothetical protein
MLQEYIRECSYMEEGEKKRGNAIDFVLADIKECFSIKSKYYYTW